MVNYCCVPSCNNSNYKTLEKIKMHRFPVDDEVCNIWIARIQNKKFEGKSCQQIRKSYRVCDIHFSVESKIPNGRGRGFSNLKFGSVPSKYLPHFKDNVNEESHEVIVSGSSDFIEENKENIPHQCVVKNPINQPSTSKTNILDIHISRKGSRKSLNILHTMGAKSSKELLPQSKQLYKLAIKLRNTARRLSSKLTNARNKLREAEKFLRSPDYLRAKVNKPTFTFIMSQLKLQKISPKGRRFSLEDKIFALPLLKQSPRGYKLLRKIFCLPSRKTLTNLLQKIPFGTGLNKSIFVLLKNNIAKLPELDKLCTIVFDEMSLESRVHYNESKDIIEGFEDIGIGKRKPVFANKVIVFMARGVYRKWKQPLAYYFTEDGLKSNNLVVLLKDVIRSTKETGLKVIATVCDQGGPNRSAISHLYAETNEQYLREGKEKRNFGFEIDGDEIVPLYDPPHLLKCVRNCLFQYDISYTWRNGYNKIASWKYIRLLYELDDKDVDYKLCSKLTDAHIENSKKMKVSIAAQTLSSRVAAAIKSLARLNPQNIYNYSDHSIARTMQRAEEDVDDEVHYNLDVNQNTKFTSDSEQSEFVETTIEELLISCVQARPALWNCRLPLKERSKNIRDELWLEIFREFGEQEQFSLEFLTKKWRNLRDTYVRMKGEQESLTRSGSARQKKMKWAFYDHLKFLDDTLKHRLTVTNIHEPTTSTPSSPLLQSPSNAAEDVDIGYTRKTSTKKAAETAIIDALTSISSEGSQSHSQSATVDVNPICMKISQMLSSMPTRERTELEITLLQMTYDKAKLFL